MRMKRNSMSDHGPVVRHIFLCAGLFIAALATFTDALGQPASIAEFAGDYYLRETDVASAIRLRSDGTYEFFTMIGSVDERDEGTWTLRGTRIVAKSKTPDTPPKLQFVSSSTVTQEGARIRLTGADAKLVNDHLWVRLDLPDGKSTTTHQDGDDTQYNTVKPPIRQIRASITGGFRDYGVVVITPAAPEHNLFVFSVAGGNLGIMRLDGVQISREDENLKFIFPGDKMRRALMYYRVAPVKPAASQP
jgi:hypothetical protein